MLVFQDCWIQEGWKRCRVRFPNWDDCQNQSFERLCNFTTKAKWNNCCLFWQLLKDWNNFIAYKNVRQFFHINYAQIQVPNHFFYGQKCRQINSPMDDDISSCTKMLNASGTHVFLLKVTKKAIIIIMELTLWLRKKCHVTFLLFFLRWMVPHLVLCFFSSSFCSKPLHFFLISTWIFYIL